MTPAAPLWLFCLLVLGVIVLPGLDMAYVLGSALTGGRGRGLAAVAGIVAGGVCHVLMAALGISVLLRLFPALFNALLLGGALYIAWIGLSLLRSTAPLVVATAATAAQPWTTTFRRGLVTCLLNPKAYLFTLAVFPQFLRPGMGTFWLQVGVLWLIIALNQVCIYGGLALLAARLRVWLQGRPAANLLATRGVGALLVGAGVLTGFAGWQQF
jgi:threonine/homoserine/homoserine lactone efflux protein